MGMIRENVMQGNVNVNNERNQILEGLQSTSTKINFYFDSFVIVLIKRKASRNLLLRHQRVYLGKLVKVTTQGRKFVSKRRPKSGIL